MASGGEVAVLTRLNGNKGGKQQGLGEPIFTQGRDGSFAIAAAAPCRPASKTATAEMPANGLGGNVLLWVPSHIRCFPRAAGHRVVSCLSTLEGRAHHHLVCITGKAGTRTDVERESLRQKPQVPATRHGFCRTPQRQKPDGKNRSFERGLNLSSINAYIL
ncbi:hypothetical protein GWK47_024433 [Chionoecetes opilio]|uniref:Uncharacterized protein n=1 Tax=Chionoecetes opilio TaxID=41210 RepID=A0A8J4XM87_CHIOP|nr:hypothetical protein GWK47_024433 [Chionoecetes opilio]